MFNDTLKKRDKGRDKRWFIRGPISSLAFIALLLYIFAVLLSKEIMPSSLMNECAILSVFLGTAAGGMIAARIKGEGVLTAGALTGSLVLAVIAIVILLRPSGTLLCSDTLKTAICAIGGGTFGGAVCLQRPGIKKRKKIYARK